MGSSDKRQATVAQRIYPHTQKRLRSLAKGRGLDCAALLDQLVPHKRRSDGYGPCIFCSAEMKNPRGKHRGHKSFCVLWEDKELPE